MSKVPGAQRVQVKGSGSVPIATAMVVSLGSAFGTARCVVFLSNFCFGQVVSAQVFASGEYTGCLGQKGVAVSVVATDT